MLIQNITKCTLNLKSTSVPSVFDNSPTTDPQRLWLTLWSTARDRSVFLMQTKWDGLNFPNGTTFQFPFIAFFLLLICLHLSLKGVAAFTLCSSPRLLLIRSSSWLYPKRVRATIIESQTNLNFPQVYLLELLKSCL